MRNYKNKNSANNDIFKKCKKFYILKIISSLMPFHE